MSALFAPELVRIVDTFKTKSDCLDYMAELLDTSGCLLSADRYLAAVKGREEIMSTGIGRGIAIPHARDLTVSCLKMAVCRIQAPLDFDSVDNLPVNLVFMFAVPQNSNQEYMRTLRKISEFLRQEENRAKLLGSKSDLELYKNVQEMESTFTDPAAD